MTPKELYKILEDNNVPFDIVEVFEGVRFIRVEIEEEEEDALK